MPCVLRARRLRLLCLCQDADIDPAAYDILHASSMKQNNFMNLSE
jgi:hypothetical protein